MTASFFVLRKHRNELFDMCKRIEDLEYDRLLEAYRRAGYDVD